jgi:putative aldouronate transport system substrate-binding protein
MYTDRKKSISRRQFLKLAGTVAVSAALGGCQPAAAPEAAKPTDVPDAAKAPAAPALEEIELVYTYPGTVPADVDLVAAELSKTTREKFNATVKLQPVDWGTFEERIRLASAAGEKIDLEFTATWMNNYAQNVANGNLVGLDDLLTQAAPGLWASMAPTTWDAARVEDKIYGAINQQIFVKDWGVANLRKDLAEKYKIDLNPMKRYEDVEPALKILKDGEGGEPVVVGETESVVWRSEYFGFDPALEIVGNCTLAGVKYDDPSRKAISIVDQPEFKQAIELTRKWKKAGYLTDPLAAEEGDAIIRAGTSGYIGFHIIKPGGTDETKAKYGYDWIAKGMSPWMLTTGGVQATMTGISRTAANAERAMMFLELLNTDVDFYNLICNGIEGKHWVWVDQAKKLIGYPSGVTPETCTYHPNTDWMFGCVWNSYYWTEAAANGNIWEATRKMNADATPSSVLGFSFVQDPVKTEMSQITNVANELFKPIIQGMVDADPGVTELQKALKDAGIDKVIAEVQKQIDAWAGA